MLAFRCSSIVYRTLCYQWLMSTILFLEQDDDTDQEITNGDGKDRRKTTGSSKIEEDDLDHQLEVLLLIQACQDKSLLASTIPQQNIPSCADILIARPLQINAGNPAGAIAWPLVKHQKSTLFNLLSMSDCTPSTQVLLQPKTSGVQILPQPTGYCIWVCSPTPIGYFWGSEKVHGGNRIHK